MYVLSSADLEFILNLARSKTLTNAAKNLNVEQSTVSRQLQSLEQKYGGLLFARTKTGLIPNSKTKKILEWSEKLELLLKQAHVSTSRSEDFEVSEVHITAPDLIIDFILAPELEKFNRDHPNICLKLTAASQIIDLNQLDCDLAIRVGIKPTGNSIFIKIGESSMGLYGSKKFLSESNLASIKVLPVIKRQESATPDEKWLEATAKNIIVRANNMTTCLLAVQKGAGVMILPDRLGKIIPDIYKIHIEEEIKFVTDIYLASPEAVRKLKNVDQTWKWIKTVFQKRFN